MRVAIRFSRWGDRRGLGGWVVLKPLQRAVRSIEEQALRARFKSSQCTGLLWPKGGGVSFVYRDIGTKPRTKLYRSSTCTVADHHADTTVVKGRPQHWTYVCTRCSHVRQCKTKEMTSMRSGSGQAWLWQGRKSLWKAKGAMLKLPEDHVKGRPLNHDVWL